MRSFVKIKSSRNGEITLWFIDMHVDESWPIHKILTSQIMSFNAIRKNNILAKISEFTVCMQQVLSISPYHLPLLT